MKAEKDTTSQEAGAPPPRSREVTMLWSRVIHELLRPNILIPATLSIALLATLLSVGNVRKILADLSAFQPLYLLWYALVMTLQICVRGLLWHVLIRSLRAHVPARSQALAYLVGEITKILPLGNYFPNYVLSRSTRAAFGLTSAATMAMTLLEVSVALVGIAVLGLGVWTGWLRPLILIGSGAFLLIVWGVYRVRGVIRPIWIAVRQRHGMLQRLGDEVQQAGVGLSQLWQVRVVLAGLLICAGYTGLAGFGLWLIAHGLGLDSVSIPQALSAYWFSLAFALIEPTPVDLGVMEAGGVGAFLAIGVPIDLAISIMLIQRVLSTGVSLAVATIGMAILRRDLGALLRSPPV